MHTSYQNKLKKKQKNHFATKTGLGFNQLPHDKISHRSTLKAFPDDKLNVNQNIKVVFHRIENIVRKEENAG